jgi:hypothetical protein
MMQDVHTKLHPGWPWQKQYSTDNTLFTNKTDLNLRKKPVKCYIWRIALYDAANWTLRKVDQKYLVSSEMWCCRRMEKISCTDRARNDKVRITQVKEDRNILHTIKIRKADCDWLHLA